VFESRSYWVRGYCGGYAEGVFSFNEHMFFQACSGAMETGDANMSNLAKKKRDVMHQT
jgi:hypothetical protein